MVGMGYYTEIILAFFTLCFLCCVYIRHSRRLLNFPIVGMLPHMLVHFDRLPDTAAEILELNNGTFRFKSVWFSGVDMIITSDPLDVQHVMSTNYSNYLKGPELTEMFDILGYLFFNVDFEPHWRVQRKVIHAYLKDKRFRPFSQKVNHHCLVNGLMPFLEHVSGKGEMVDLQDVFQRFQYDAIAMTVAGRDPGSLRVGFPKAPFCTAMNDANQAIFLRHILPGTCWKLLRTLGLGSEKRLSKALQTLDEMAKDYIEMRSQEVFEYGYDHREDERFDLLKCFLTKDMVVEGAECTFSNLRDWIVNLFWAGRDTTSAVLSWFFWLISKNPSVEYKLREELAENLPLSTNHQKDNDQNYRLFDVDDLNKLVYLHAALCETLRLYPPGPFQPRSPTKPDILPSGHKVDPKIKVVVCGYGVGRMKSTWGEDCLEFKPERWLTSKGGLKHVPSNKFLAFNSGPRKCSGMELAFGRMKCVVAAIICNYNVEVIKDQDVGPATSVILQMKHGLKVKITKRMA